MCSVQQARVDEMLMKFIKLLQNIWKTNIYSRMDFFSSIDVICSSPPSFAMTTASKDVLVEDEGILPSGGIDVLHSTYLRHTHSLHTNPWRSLMTHTVDLEIHFLQANLNGSPGSIWSEGNIGIKSHIDWYEYSGVQQRRMSIQRRTELLLSLLHAPLCGSCCGFLLMEVDESQHSWEQMNRRTPRRAPPYCLLL